MNVPNLDRFSGIAGIYNQSRPGLPPAFVDLLIQLAGETKPALVVDLGCGTGLSTRIWAGRAQQIIGIEPNQDMRQEAERQTSDDAIRYQDGISSQTGLADGSADIVTISQALHWMEPAPTFAEVARILRSGGVFAAIDGDWPPAMQWEAEAAFSACLEQAEHLIDQNTRMWDKGGHLGRMQASGLFRYVNEVVLHHVEQGNADRLVGLALSQGRVSLALRQGFSEDEIGLTRLREVAARTLGDKWKPWYFGYRVRLGIK